MYQDNNTYGFEPKPKIEKVIECYYRTGKKGNAYFSPTPPTDFKRLWYWTTENLLMAYDTTRSKWLSIEEKVIGAARHLSNVKSQYLAIYDSQKQSKTGWRVVRNATIITLSAQSSISATWDLEIYKNGGGTPISSLAVSGTIGNDDKTIDINVNAGDFIQLSCKTTGINTVDNPLGELYYKYRY